MKPSNLAFWILTFNHAAWKQQSSLRFTKTVFFVLKRKLSKLAVFFIVILLDNSLDFWVYMSLPGFILFCSWFEHMLGPYLLFQIGPSQTLFSCFTQVLFNLITSFRCNLLNFLSNLDFFVAKFSEFFLKLRNILNFWVFLNNFFWRVISIFLGQVLNIRLPKLFEHDIKPCTLYVQILYLLELFSNVPLDMIQCGLWPSKSVVHVMGFC